MQQRTPTLLAAFAMLAGAAIMVLSSCGGSVVTSPLAAPTGTGSVAVVGAQSSPYPLGTPAGTTGALTGAQLESLLDAAQTPAPGTGAILGVVTSVNSGGFAMEQPLALATPAAGSGADVHNYAAFGVPGEPINVTTNASTLYDNGTSAASIQPGALLAVTGTPVATGLTATYVGLLVANEQAAQITSHAVVSTVRASVAGATAAGAAAVRRPLSDVTQNGFLAASIGTPPIAYDNPVYEIHAGCAALLVHTQTAIDLGLQYAFPYALSYNPNPPLYQSTGSGYNGPGPYEGWLALEGLPAPAGQSTATVGVGFAFGVKLTLKPCPNTMFAGRELTLTSATFGYDVHSTTASSMPSDGQQVALTPGNCAGITQPFNISFVTDPKTGFPDLSPFNGTSSFQLSLCDPAVLTGASVAATIGNLQGGTGGAGTFALNPQSGVPVSEPGQLVPQANRLQFQLTDLAYPLTMQDKLAVQLQIADQSLFQTPATGIFNPGTYHIVPTSAPQTLTIGAQGAAQPLCIAIGTGDPIGASSTCSGSGGVVTSYICNNPPAPASCTSDTTSKVTVSLTEANYSGPIVGTDTTIPAGITTSYNELCGDGQTYANPITFSGASGDAGTGPTANFTISAANGVTSTLEDCYIVFYDSNNSSVAIDLKML